MMGRFTALVALLATFGVGFGVPLLRHTQDVPGTNTERMLQETGDDQAESTFQNVGKATTVKKTAPDPDLIPNVHCYEYMCPEDYVLIDGASSVECIQSIGCDWRDCCVYYSKKVYLDP